MVVINNSGDGFGIAAFRHSERVSVSVFSFTLYYFPLLCRCRLLVVCLSAVGRWALEFFAVNRRVLPICCYLLLEGAARQAASTATYSTAPHCTAQRPVSQRFYLLVFVIQNSYLAHWLASVGHLFWASTPSSTSSSTACYFCLPANPQFLVPLRSHFTLRYITNALHYQYNNVECSAFNRAFSRTTNTAPRTLYLYLL